jgi:hypothetical protein
VGKLFYKKYEMYLNKTKSRQDDERSGIELSWYTGKPVNKYLVVVERTVVRHHLAG